MQGHLTGRTSPIALEARLVGLLKSVHARLWLVSSVSRRAPHVFDAMVKKGALRPVNGDEDAALDEVLTFLRRRIRGDRTGHAVIREGLEQMDPDVERPTP